MSKKQTIGDRLQWLMEQNNLGITDFAKSISVDGSQFGKIVAGKMGITLKQILEISSIYNVRAGWVIDGEEPKYKKESGSLEPDLIIALRKQLDFTLSNLMEARRMLGEPLGPEITAENSHAFGRGKTKKTGKPKGI